MKNILLTTLSAATLASVATAQISPSQTTVPNGNGTQTTTTIDCFKFNVTGGDPLGSNIINGSTFTFKGNLSNGTYNTAGIDPFSLTSTVYSESGSTVASLSSGILTFSGNVGFIDNLATATGLPTAKNLECRVLDFSYTKCTAVNEGSDLFKSIQENDAKFKTYYGIQGETDKSVVYADAFKRSKDGKSFEYDSSSSKVDADTKRQETLWYFDADKKVQTYSAKALDEGSVTILKDFTVCTECKEVTQVPEPSSTLLVGLAGLAGLIRRKR